MLNRTLDQRGEWEGKGRWGEEGSSIPRDIELQCGGGGGNSGRRDGGDDGVKVAATELWKQMRRDGGGGGSWTGDGGGSSWISDGGGAAGRRRGGVVELELHVSYSRGRSGVAYSQAARGRDGVELSGPKRWGAVAPGKRRGWSGRPLEVGSQTTTTNLARGRSCRGGFIPWKTQGLGVPK
jgi:hypothetical protein